MRLFPLLLLMAMLMAGCAHDKKTAAAEQPLSTRQALEQLTTGTRLLNEGKLDQAEPHLLKAVEAESSSGLAHNNLGKLHYLKGRYYEAAWQFQYAAKLLPNSPEPRNNLGLVLEVTGKLDDAIKQYEQALLLQPENRDARANLARAHVRRGDRDEATDKLLEEVAAKDSRPEWRDWASREIISRQASPRTRPADSN